MLTGACKSLGNAAEAGECVAMNHYRGGPAVCGSGSSGGSVPGVVQTKAKGSGSSAPAPALNEVRDWWHVQLSRHAAIDSSDEETKV